MAERTVVKHTDGTTITVTTTGGGTGQAAPNAGSLFAPYVYYVARADGFYSNYVLYGTASPSDVDLASPLGSSGFRIVGAADSTFSGDSVAAAARGCPWRSCTGSAARTRSRAC